ncbi:ankyrin repeat domain-containing protein [Streptomyces sp. NPDC020983]|uniref:ankyrin repeat domain-containing protein n=1 Tax=Streptomyces sp. NPDC020983 TaxID=3365106 RepID=UPI00378CF4DB
MGFFDDLVTAGEPAEAAADEQAVVARLRPGGAAGGEYAPPADHFAPAVLPGAGVVGEGAEVRVVSVGWSVWPRALTARLTVFRTVLRQEPAGRGRRQSGLRIGLLLADGRRVTSLDGTVMRHVTYTDAQGRAHKAATPQAVGLIPLDPGLGPSHRSPFRTDVDLYLPELPPPGATELVVEWPDEGIPETRTPLDTAAIRAAAERAVEVWPGLPEPAADPAGPRAFAHMERSGPPAFLAPPLTPEQRAELRRAQEARQRYVPRADWRGMGYRDWEDAALVRARLEGGAPADRFAGTAGTGAASTPLHMAAERGTAEAVAALLAHGAPPDVRDPEGHTPLWAAACALDEGSVRALLDAGADAWTPQDGPWSPGRLLLTTPLAPLVAGLPGAVRLSAAEADAFAEADTLVAAFDTRGLWTEGLGTAFVRGVTEEELIRRLGADPARCPRTAIEDAPFDEDDVEESLRHVGVTALPGDPGGCALTQQGHLPDGGSLLSAVSAGTEACGLYFNPKGGTFFTLAKDGEVVASGELGSPVPLPVQDAYWRFRFWQTRPRFPYGANALAYACAAAGLRVADARAAVDNRAERRWVPLPARLQS